MELKCIVLYFIVLEGQGANAPLLLAPVEGVGPSGPTGGPSGPARGPLGPAGGPFGPCCGPLDPSLRIITYLYTNIVVTGEITKISVTPSILVELT